MRIKEIKIEGLFGMFNHTIPMHPDHLTIIYGENGIGKTMIFKILERIFDLKIVYTEQYTLHAYWKELLSDDIKISFNDDTTIHLNEENLSIENYLNEVFSKRPKINTALIDTQRLIYLDQTAIEQRNEKGNIISITNGTIENSINLYAKSIAKLLESKRHIYEELSSKLKNSLDQRIFDNTVKTDYSIDELQVLASEVSQKKKALQIVGLLPNVTNGFHITPDLNEVKRAILAVNLQDMKTQMEFYDEDNFYECVRLFLEILNERRLTYKKIRLDEKKGFIFENDKGAPLQPNQLSSGEQHEIILLFHLLFVYPKGAFIMIDEPEISLHAAWKIEFIEDMQDIIKVRGFDILLATHSAAIINGNWDLTVSLRGGHDE